MISKRDLKPFLVKFVVGNRIGNSPDPVFGEYICIQGLISDPEGRIVKQPYGNEFAFDRVIVVNATSTTRRIAQDTAVLLGEYPTINFFRGNYKISKVFPEYNREIVIGLEKIEGIDIPNIYYEYNGEILTYQLNFDSTTNTGYVDKNRYVPFTSTTKIWTRKPSSIDSKNHLIKLVSSKNVGVDESHKYFTQLKFEVVNG